MELKIIYGVIAVISLILIAGYSILIRKRELWFVLLYVSVFVVNIGYFALSVSGTLEEALLANRMSYLGAVFLPLCMMMIIADVCHCKRPRWIVCLAVFISVVVFIIAASQGYCDLYYKSVSVEFINGAARLIKDYGPLHNLYYVYLTSYMAAMIGIIVYAYVKRKVIEYKHAIFLACIVLGNICVWGIGQLIDMEFEFLSISYIITEIFLLFLYMYLQDMESKRLAALMAVETATETVRSLEEVIGDASEIAFLTEREKEVLKLILEDAKRKDIADELGVSENTIKKHTANIFSKLGVTSRKELYNKLGYRP